MKNFESLKEAKPKSGLKSGIERKQFMYSAGLLALGGFLLAKFPIKFISKRAENLYSSEKKIQLKSRVMENPESVKRINATKV
ncbi:MAG: hypothetical protein WC644_02975 [Ignavibacteria bacterium]